MSYQSKLPSVDTVTDLNGIGVSTQVIHVQWIVAYWITWTIVEFLLERADHLLSLQLDHNAITVLPRAIHNFTNLLSLDISNNHMTYLSPEIAQLTQLRNLNARNNDFDDLSLPKEMETMVSLKVSHLNYSPPLALNNEKWLASSCNVETSPCQKPVYPRLTIIWCMPALIKFTKFSFYLSASLGCKPSFERHHGCLKSVKWWEVIDVDWCTVFSLTF